MEIHHRILRNGRTNRRWTEIFFNIREVPGRYFMKTETIHAIEMVRQIRDRQVTLYWKDKNAYIRRMKEAAKIIEQIITARTNSKQEA